MKKNYFKIAASGLLVFLMVACGLEFTEIKFSSHAIYPGDQLTIDMKLERPNGANTDWVQGNFNYYYYLGVRVPQDWTTAEMLTAKDSKWMGGTTEFKFEDSEFYAALLELCYPKAGFKWLAYQTTEPYQINGEPTDATLVLKSSESTGEFRLDFMGGSSKSKPSDLYSNGAINYDLAFNNTGNLKVIDGTKYVSCQEYLFNASTLTQEEIDGRETALFDIKANGYPITAMDVVNYEEKNNSLKEAYLKDEEKTDDDKAKVKITNLDLTINVATTNTGIDEVYESSLIDAKAVNGGIEVVANGATATVYDMAGCIIATEFVNGDVTIAARPGAYIVRIIEGNRSLVNKVIVK
ncbi:MAG: T9SS type A sorting domain-containing protein [Muribaculaceae bacterium]|nr:T9SS type A sorting domain-containing protein [Muribaculaceae bacterium]